MSKASLSGKRHKEQFHFSAPVMLYFDVFPVVSVPRLPSGPYPIALRLVVITSLRHP